MTGEREKELANIPYLNWSVEIRMRIYSYLDKSVGFYYNSFKF